MFSLCESVEFLTWIDLLCLLCSCLNSRIFLAGKIWFCSNEFPLEVISSPALKTFLEQFNFTANWLLAATWAKFLYFWQPACHFWTGCLLWLATDALHAGRNFNFVTILVMYPRAGLDPQFPGMWNVSKSYIWGPLLLIASLRASAARKRESEINACQRKFEKCHQNLAKSAAVRLQVRSDQKGQTRII